jgi:hypothetical protein
MDEKGGSDSFPVHPGSESVQRQVSLGQLCSSLIEFQIDPLSTMNPKQRIKEHSATSI